VTGIDFSGGMLAECRRRLEKQVEGGDLVLERCVAERLPFEAESFDMIIAGFGFLSYSDSPRVLKEICRVGTATASVLLSTYNYEAAFYDIWGKRLAEPTVPISGKIDRDRGVLRLDGHSIGVRPMTHHEVERLLLHHGLKIEEHEHASFPTLYAILSSNESSRLPVEEIDPSEYHGFANFSPRLFDQDKAVSRALGERGYYFLDLCRRAAPDEERAAGGV